MTLRMYLPKLSTVIAILLSAAVFMLAGAFVNNHNTSYADTPPPSSPAGTNLQTPDGVGCNSLPESRGGVLLGKIVPCLGHVIEIGAVSMSRAMIEYLKPLFYSYLTLVMVFFGVKIVQNEGQIQGQVFGLLLKVGFCLTMFQMIPGPEGGDGGLISTSYKIMAESQSVVMDVLDTTSMNCPVGNYQGAQTPRIWVQMDCLLGKLYGFTTGTATDSGGNKKPSMLLASSVLGLMAGFFFGGTFGVALFFLCIGMLWSLFMLVVRVVVAFLNAYMFIALYMIIAPLLLPMIFLRATNSIFDKWLSGVVAALLMPLVICAYSVLALQMYDGLLFSDNAEIKKLFDYEWVQKAQLPSKDLCKTQLINNPTFRESLRKSTADETYGENPFLQTLQPSIANGANNLCGGLQKTNLDLKALTGDQIKDQREGFYKMFLGCIKLFIMAYLIDIGFKSTVQAVRPMLGSGAVVASLDVGTKAEQSMRQRFGDAKSRFSNYFARSGPAGDDGPAGTYSGTKFLTRVPGALNEGARGFMGMQQRAQSSGADAGDDTTPDNPDSPASSGDRSSAGGPTVARSNPSAAPVKGARDPKRIEQLTELMDPNDKAEFNTLANRSRNAKEQQRYEELLANAEDKEGQ